MTSSQAVAPPSGPEAQMGYPIQFWVGYPDRPLSRLSTAFRIILVIPEQPSPSPAREPPAECARPTTAPNVPFLHTAFTASASGFHRRALACIAVGRGCFASPSVVPDGAALGGGRIPAASMVVETGGHHRRRRRGSGHPGHSPKARGGSMRVPVRPLVGRDADLVVLDQALARARRGDGSAVVVLGEPGIGKTRFLHEVRRLARIGEVTVTGSASEFGGALPYGAFVAALDDYVQTVEARLLGTLDDEQHATLAALLPSYPVAPQTSPRGTVDAQYQAHRAMRALL